MVYTVDSRLAAAVHELLTHSFGNTECLLFSIYSTTGVSVTLVSE